ncbi:MAG: SDR family oxidoreductase [Pirellulales bacterium]
MEVLKGRAALVSGASRGIGLATGVALSEAGASVAFNYYDDPHEAPAAIERITRAGRRAILVQGDVAEQSAVERMVAETVAAFGQLDIAVANAAYSDRALFYEADMAEFRRTVDVTMWGALHVARAAARQMIAQARAGGAPGGSIVVVSSPHAKNAIPFSMAYNMSKGAVVQMARTAALELVEHKIRVNLVTPGWTDTPGERKFASDETIAAASEKLPWKRLAQPAEIGRAVVFFCDPASDYITGSSLLVDGGITLPWWANRGSGVPA